MATTSRPLHLTTYLLGVCLFSISFLVFLNSSVSFLITDLIGVKKGVGNLVGTLGFADELVALVACPLWGALSDRVGVRTVCVVGYCIVAVALFLFVQTRNVYPQLLLVRLLFSVGGAATSTMVTAVLPALAYTTSAVNHPSRSRPTSQDRPGPYHSTSPSLSSELTITPARLANSSLPRRADRRVPSKPQQNPPDPSKLAGIVGLFTGCGALLALLVFLPLPAWISKLHGISRARGVVYSYYVVGSIALLIAACCFVGLRGLKAEETKGWGNSFGRSGGDPGHGHSQEDGNPSRASPSTSLGLYWNGLAQAVAIAFRDVNIGLGYLGGFVARASSVGISLFIPLFVNAYFISSGLCKGDDSHDTEEMKRQCRRAYKLAAQLTGISQLVALICAPIFGFLSHRYQAYNLPLLTAALAGIVGYIAFALRRSPEPAGEHGSPLIFLIVALLGISQIGAIVCSLGQLGRGILGGAVGIEGESFESLPPPTVPTATFQRQDSRRNGRVSPGSVSTPDLIPGTPDETTHLLAHNPQPTYHPNPTTTTTTHPTNGDGPMTDASTVHSSLQHLKGSIAGVYSLSGGAGILLLTKLGGTLFDSLSPAAPFYMLAAFNGVLLVACVAAGVGGEVARRRVVGGTAKGWGGTERGSTGGGGGAGAGEEGVVSEG